MANRGRFVLKRAEQWVLWEPLSASGSNWVGNSYALNTALLRDEWGYKGYIVSDLGAIQPSGRRLLQLG